MEVGTPPLAPTPVADDRQDPWPQSVTRILDPADRPDCVEAGSLYHILRLIRPSEDSHRKPVPGVEERVQQSRERRPVAVASPRQSIRPADGVDPLHTLRTPERCR